MSTTTVDKIRFALLGCGRIARKHAGLLAKQIPGAELVAVCDIVPERVQRCAKEYGIPGFASLAEMMAAKGDDIDVVNVLTPTGCHAQNVLDISQYGKHVVVEKPMALVLDDAEAMVLACERAGVRLFVVKQNRYNLPIQKLRQAIDKGRFGKIVMATARVRWCRTQEYYEQDAWRGTWLWDGGSIANQASHHVDLLTWLVGDVDSVFCYTATQLVDIEAEDMGVAVMKFRCGALGVFESTTATRPMDLEASISILGEHGAVEIGGFAVNEVRSWNFTHAEPGDEEVLSKYKENPPNVYGFGHLEYLKHVVEAIRSNSTAMVDGIEGMKSLRLINAMYESSESRSEVALRFVPHAARLGKRKNRRKHDEVHNTSLPWPLPEPVGHNGIDIVVPGSALPPRKGNGKARSHHLAEVS